MNVASERNVMSIDKGHDRAESSGPRSPGPKWFGAELTRNVSFASSQGPVHSGIFKMASAR